MRLILGDALEMLPALEAGSVDCIVTDPPAGIGFMGKTWDTPKGYGFTDGARRTGEMPATMNAARNPVCRRCHKHQRGKAPRPVCSCAEPDFDTLAGQARERRAFVAFLSAVLAECLRVAKPGARLLCWAIPRTSHWTGLAVEEAGWLIEDRISHLFGQGFPKGKGKLKPACEDWWLARKPGGKVPALGIDECRVACAGGSPSQERRKGKVPVGSYNGWDVPSRNGYGDPHKGEHIGRWPANLVLSHVDGPDGCRCVGTKRVKGSRIDKPAEPTPDNRVAYGRQGAARPPRGIGDADGMETVEVWECHPECAVRLLDEQSGVSKSSGGVNPSGLTGNIYGVYAGRNGSQNQGGLGDTGGASRFFFCAKASRRDRGEDNTHPTVKPLALCRWLVKLVCPPGGVVLDPFAGSGTTGVACLQTGRDAVLIEKEPAYHAIASRRLALAQGPLFAPQPGAAP